MSSRFVWPYLFSLRVRGLVEALRQQKVPPVRDKFFAKSTGNPLPIALRWSYRPDLGFPREPFQVFRRLRSPATESHLFVQVLAQSVPITTQPLVSAFAGDAAYVVNAVVGVPSGTNVTVEALDSRSQPIPGHTVTVTVSSIVQFRCPGIASVRAFGTGAIGPVSVIPETVYANLPDWQRIQTVGLPLSKNEIGAAYNTLPQGIEPPSQDGVTFAIERMLITTLLQVDPFGTGIADFPLPAWPVPNPNAYVTNIRGAKSLVLMIKRCLQQSVDSDPNKQQAQYAESVTIPGIKQSNAPGAIPDPAQTTQAALPIVGVGMLAASTDSYAAVSLGYGTVDVPPPPQAPAPTAAALPTTHPVVDTGLAYDYMVTAPFVFAALNFTMKVTLAALSAGEAPVAPPAALNATVKQVYPPIHRNQAAPASIRVSWAPPGTPQEYGILASHAPNTSQVLNSPRPPAVKGFDPFIGLLPNPNDPNTPPDQQTPSFSDATVSLPIDVPPTTARYLVAGLDVFGVWSGWTAANATLSPSGITKPGIRNVQFAMDPAHATGHVVPARMRIECAWDWQDRAPGQIRFTGHFVPSGSGLGPAAFLAGFQMSNTGLVGPAVTLTFHYANQADADTIPAAAKVPTIDAGHSIAGSVIVLPANPADPDNQQVVYRFDLNGISLDFSSADELDFALYVTASEERRPGEFSDPTDPVMGFVGKVVKASDPIPPTVTFIPPSISWTALPDATGIARGLLEWTPDPKAAGYYVWEATESALWHLLSPGTADPSPETPLVARGASLKALIDSQADASLQGFARLNRDPIPGARTEIRVPSAASTLYAYRISAISTTNVEAQRSSQVAIFGVPRRNVPGTPRLLLRKPAAPQTGIQVIALPVESGPVPAGYRAFRVQNPSLSLDPSTMGPPKFDEHNPGWQDFSGSTLAGRPLSGKSIVDAGATPSWYPYYYRITGIGVEDVANGLISGESGYSGAQSQYSLPANPPLMALFTHGGNPQFALISLRTDLPIAPSPLGSALVELLHLTQDATNPARMVSNVVFASAPDQIAIGGIVLPPAQPSHPPHPHPPIPPLPPIPLPPPPTTRFARATPDVTGRWTLMVLLPYTSVQKNQFAVRLTDPLGRQSTRSF